MPPREEADNAEASENQEGAEGEGEGEEQVFCVRPAPGERSKWPADQDCMSMKDWMASQGLYGSEASEESEEGGSEEGGESGGEEASESQDPAQDERYEVITMKPTSS